MTSPLDSLTACPNASAHNDDKPSDYTQEEQWARRKLRTHEQTQCPDCGLWVIWVPKTKANR